MMKEELEPLLDLSPEEILAIPSGKWSDSDLLDVYGEFADELRMEKETAVLELILQSPQHDDDMVDYGYLYHEILTAYNLNLRDFTRATYWGVAAIGYEAQHERRSLGFRNYQRELAESYLRQGDIANGLRLFTRLMQTNPGDFWTHNQLVDVLPDVGLHQLALKVLEQALEIMADYDPEGLASQFEDYQQEISEKMATAVVTPPDIDLAVLDALHKALALPQLPDDVEMLEHISPIGDLLDQGDTLDEKLRQAIVAQGRVFIPDLIWLAFDETYWDTPASNHAIALLRQIRQQEPALEAIGRWLDQADGNWQALLSDNMGKIGGYATAELKTFAADTNYDVFLRHDAAEALLQRIQNSPEQRAEIIKFVRTLLTRPEAYEASEELFIAFLIADITDTDAKELYPEIKQVFDEDRLDPTITDLPHIHEKWGLPPLEAPPRNPDLLLLTLKCTQCGRTRNYQAAHVTLDSYSMENAPNDHPYSPYIASQPIICPKCGAVDRYKVDPLTSLRLLMGGGTAKDVQDLLSSQGKGTFQPKPSPHVTRMYPQAFGRDMHPLVAIDKYKEMSAHNPKSAEPHWRMGNILRMIRRDEQAREAYLRALELDPQETWAIYCLATIAHDWGNDAEAKAFYQQTMKAISPMAMMRDAELANLSLAAADGLKRLQKGLPSEYTEEYRTPKPDEPSKTAVRAQRHQSNKKKNKKKRRR